MPEEFYLAETKPVDHDSSIDAGIRECLRIGSGESFITFAGAGSGKTYSLKEAPDFLKEEHSDNFVRQGKQIAVVTFTNNAANEIKDRIEQKPIFAVSTIHSFCWSAIAGFNEDIRKWYLEKIPADIAEVEDLERRGRAGKASDARKRTIIRLTEKMEWLAEPRSFIYDPNGVNSSQNALSHADVLKIFSSFLRSKPMMAEVIVSKFPFIFIDESQDTNKDVVSAFFELQDAKSDEVVIGLLGDPRRGYWSGEPCRALAAANQAVADALDSYKRGDREPVPIDLEALGPGSMAARLRGGKRGAVANQCLIVGVPGGAGGRSIRRPERREARLLSTALGKIGSQPETMGYRGGRRARYSTVFGNPYGTPDLTWVRLEHFPVLRPSKIISKPMKYNECPTSPGSLRTKLTTPPRVGIREPSSSGGGSNTKLPDVNR